VKVANVPVIRLRLAIIRLTLAPKQDDALVIIAYINLHVLAMPICCHRVHPVPTG